MRSARSYLLPLLALFGSAAGMIYAAIDALDKIGPMRFVREDLVQAEAR